MDGREQAIVGVALWPDAPPPAQKVTAMVLCRQSCCLATGTDDGSIWLWRTPAEWQSVALGPRPQGMDDHSQAEAGAGQRVQPLALLCGQHAASITSMVTAFDCQQHVLLSADARGGMCVWRVEDGVCLKTSNVLSWGPRTMVNVSCKGKTLVACCGPSPDIEVIDAGSMKRIVRLFGHGDWCTDLRVRPREALMQLDLHSSREPSVYSLDRGGTLCVWLAERTCSATMVGWVPSVQCHRVSVEYPTSLALDKHGAALLVVGNDTAAQYCLGRDHRLADKNAKPIVYPMTETGHSAAPANGKSTETAAQRRAKRTAAATLGATAKGGDDGFDQLQVGRVWPGVTAALAPGGGGGLVLSQRGKLVVLQPEVEGQANVEVLESHGREVTVMCDDGWGWLAMANEGGDVCVWAAESPAPTDGATTDGAAEIHASVARTVVHCGAGFQVQLREWVRQGSGCIAHAFPGGWRNENAGDLGTKQADEQQGDGCAACHASVSLVHVEWEFGGLSADEVKARKRVASGKVPAGMYWVVGFEDGRVCVRALPSSRCLLWLGGKEAATGVGHTAVVSALKWVSGEDLLASGDAVGQVCVWDMPRGSMRHRFFCFTFSTAFSKNTHSAILFLIIHYACKGSHSMKLVLDYKCSECRFAEGGGPVRKIVDLGITVDAFLGHACVLLSLGGDGSIFVFAKGAKVGAVKPQDNAIDTSCEDLGAGAGSLESAVAAHTTEGLHEEVDKNIGSTAFRPCFRTGQYVVGSNHNQPFLEPVEQPRSPRAEKLFVLTGHAEEVVKVFWEERYHRLYAQTRKGEVCVWQLPEVDGSGISAFRSPPILVRRIHPVEKTVALQTLDAPLSAIKQHVIGEVAKLPADNIIMHSAPHLEEADRVKVVATQEIVFSRTGCLGAGGIAVVLMRCDAIADMIHRHLDGGSGGSGLTSSDSFKFETSMSSLSSSSLFCADGPVEDGGARKDQWPENGVPLLWEVLGGESSVFAVAIAIVMAFFSSASPTPNVSPCTDREGDEHRMEFAKRVKNAVRALGCPGLLESWLARQGNGRERGDVHYSCVIQGAGRGLTVIVPVLSSTFGACEISAHVTTTLSVCAAVLLETSRAFSQARDISGNEVLSALLQFVMKEMPVRLPRVCEPDVAGLAQHWLTAPRHARAAAYTLLHSRLARTDTNTRHTIVEEWKKKLGNGASGFGHGLEPDQLTALTLLAVVGSYFQDSLDQATAAPVAKGLMHLVASDNVEHARIASLLLSRGATVWSGHLKSEAIPLFRVLYARYWRHQDFGTSLGDAELALRSLAPVLPREFVEVLGEEMSRHSQLVGSSSGSQRSITAIRVLLAIIKRHPIPLLPALPRAVEVVLSTLDPAHPHVRQAFMLHSTAALKEIVRRFPQAAFHQTTQRFAVGTFDALVVIFDVRTATKWRVLEGHEGPVNAVTFDGAGQRLATFSVQEGRVRYWETGSSGPFGLFSNKVCRCVQQFTVPESHTRPNPEREGHSPSPDIAFGILITPTAIVLTRDNLPIAEFAIHRK